jgi:hypothetical protein
MEWAVYRYWKETRTTPQKFSSSKHPELHQRQATGHHAAPSSLRYLNESPSNKKLKEQHTIPVAIIYFH